MQTPEKISLKLQLDTDIRRITVVAPIAFAELQKQIQALFRFEAEKTFTIKYADDEGDLCTVSSDEELLEAVRFSQPTLRLQISVSQPKPKPTRSCPAWPRTSPGGCPRRCGPMGQKIRNSTDLASKAIEMMETDVPQAKALFFQQLETCPPWHIANCLYNIACCESILGNIDSALSYLSRSIDAGYRNAPHMNSDADFANIRHTDGFKELLASISEQQQPPKPQESAPGPEQLYNLARYHSLMGNLEPALNSLGKAVEAGFFKFNQLLNSPDLFPLHSVPNWEQFVNQVQQQQPKQPEPVPQPEKVVEASPAEGIPPLERIPLVKIIPVKVASPVQTQPKARLAVRRDVPVAVSAPEVIPLTQIRKVEIPAPHVVEAPRHTIPLTQIRKVGPVPPAVEAPPRHAIPLTQIRRVDAPKDVEAPPTAVVAPQEPQQPQISHPDVSQTSLDVLFEMGFLDRPRNLAALLVCGGNVEQAIARLLN